MRKKMQPPKTYRDERPWGEEFVIEFPAGALASRVKTLTVLPGQSTSLQRHKMRDEFWRVLSGNGRLEIASRGFDAVAESEHFAPRETLHRMIGGTEPLVILEVAFGRFDENDIERIEDKYGRAGK